MNEDGESHIIQETVESTFGENSKRADPLADFTLRSPGLKKQ